jgi:hypothetical protein
VASKKNQPRSPSDAMPSSQAALPVAREAIDPKRLLARGLIDEDRVAGLEKYLAAVERFRRRFGRSSGDPTELAIRAVREAVGAKAHALQAREGAMRRLRELPGRVVALHAALEPSQFEFEGLGRGDEDRADFEVHPAIGRLSDHLGPLRETIDAVRCAEDARRQARGAEARARMETERLVRGINAWLEEVLEQVVGDVRVLKADEAAAGIWGLGNALGHEAREATEERVPLLELLERLEAIRARQGRIEADLKKLHDDLGLATSLGHPADG